MTIARYTEKVQRRFYLTLTLLAIIYTALVSGSAWWHSSRLPSLTVTNQVTILLTNTVVTTNIVTSHKEESKERISVLVQNLSECNQNFSNVYKIAEKALENLKAANKTVKETQAVTQKLEDQKLLLTELVESQHIALQNNKLRFDVLDIHIAYWKAMAVSKLEIKQDVPIQVNTQRHNFISQKWQNPDNTYGNRGFLKKNGVWMTVP